MKLTKIVISGFRSVHSKQTIHMDGRITVLIGANDHGKSNILDAISRLNDEGLITEGDRNWDLPEGKVPSIEWHFAPDELDSKKLDAFAAEQLELVPAGEIVMIPKSKDGSIVFARNGVGASLTVEAVPVQMGVGAAPQVLAMRPRVELFNEQATTLKDSTDPAEIEGDLVMQGIFRLAGVWEKRASIFSQTPATTKALDAASKRLTEALNDKWNQGRDLTWILRHNSGRIEIEIGDPSIENRYSKPSLRSAGFRTYFLLSMMTLAKTSADPAGSYIFLFDEPGTYLHPHAQIDLQRSFERIADTSQIVYSTHSIFLVSKNYPKRNKVVAKSAAGTVVDHKPFIRNWKAVRESLGILFSGNFLISERTLLVEGPSDVVFVLLAMKSLKQQGLIDVDLNDFSVVDAGTAENYAAVAKVMLAEGRSVVALLDGDKSGREMKARMEKACGPDIKAGRLSFELLPENKSSEDVFVDLSGFQAAAAATAKDLVTDGFRKPAKDVDFAKASKMIVSKTGTTLGRVFDEETPSWFESNEKLSKLSVALKYESMNEEPPKVGKQVAETIARIKGALQLRGEKSAEEGIYETLK